MGGWGGGEGGARGSASPEPRSACWRSCEIASLDILADFSKLAALTLISFWFLGFFETVLWVALVAAIIPAVDAFSVFRGPTGHIVEERPSIFETIAFGFPVPGRRDIKLDWESPRLKVTGYNVYEFRRARRRPDPSR